MCTEHQSEGTPFCSVARKYLSPSKLKGECCPIITHLQELTGRLAKTRSRDKSKRCRSQHFLKGGIDKTCGVTNALCDHSRTACGSPLARKCLPCCGPSVAGRPLERGARRHGSRGAAVAPPSRRTSGSSQAASERPVPPLLGETNRCPTWLRAAAPQRSPAYAAGRAAVRSAGGSPTPSDKRGGAAAGRTLAGERASERPSVRSPALSPRPYLPSGAESSAAGFVRFVRAHLSGPPGRTPSGRAHAASHQVRGAGLGVGGAAADGETRAAWRRRGDPFPGHCRRDCSFDKKLWEPAPHSEL